MPCTAGSCHEDQGGSCARMRCVNFRTRLKEKNFLFLPLLKHLESCTEENRDDLAQRHGRQRCIERAETWNVIPVPHSSRIHQTEVNWCLGPSSGLGSSSVDLSDMSQRYTHPQEGRLGLLSGQLRGQHLNAGLFRQQRG